MLKYLVGFKPFFISDWDRVALFQGPDLPWRSQIQDGVKGLRIFIAAEKVNACWRSSMPAVVFIFIL
jgi:hypothetical protein